MWYYVWYVFLVALCILMIKQVVFFLKFGATKIPEDFRRRVLFVNAEKLKISQNQVITFRGDFRAQILWNIAWFGHMGYKSRKKYQFWVGTLYKGNNPTPEMPRPQGLPQKVNIFNFHQNKSSDPSFERWFYAESISKIHFCIY